jgi:glc operon protein GlcG
MSKQYGPTALDYGRPISLEEAKRVMAAAEEAALQRGWRMVISVVDSTAHMVMVHKMDHAQYGSVPIATLKAETALNFKRPSKLFEDAIANGGLALRLLSTPNLLTLDGGLPLIAEGAIIGAIGVSGMQSTEDAEIAQIGAGALHR